jgi:hypothetical protein
MTVARRPDPLASLVRLRRLETGAARRRLAEDAGRLLAAEARAEAAGTALLTEQGAAALPADYAAWVGRGMAERDRAALSAAHAAERLAEGRAALAEARVAERCIEQLMQDRAAAAKAVLLRKAQAATDDAAGRAAHAAGRE